jgi:hypothetical protein
MVICPVNDVESFECRFARRVEKLVTVGMSGLIFKNCSTTAVENVDPSRAARSSERMAGVHDDERLNFCFQRSSSEMEYWIAGGMPHKSI